MLKMSRFKENFKRRAVPLLTAATLLSAAGAGREYVGRRRAEIRGQQLASEVKAERANVARLVRESNRGSSFSDFVARSKEDEIAQIRRSFGARIPEHAEAVSRHLRLLATRRRFSASELRLVELGATIGAMQVALASQSGLNPGDRDRLIILRDSLRSALEKKGYGQ